MMKHLSRADEILMVAIARLGKDAYSTSIIRTVDVSSGKKLTVGSLWVSLDQLARKGVHTKTPRSFGKPTRWQAPRVLQTDAKGSENAGADARIPGEIVGVRTRSREICRFV